MTERSLLDTERAERLARLRERRTSPPSSSPPASTSRPAGTSERLLPPPVAGIATGTAAADRGLRARRRSPATNAKIITVGASATAVLGMMAGYGIADGMASEAPAESAPDVAAPPATIPPAAPMTTAPATTAPPQVIVVLVDAASGRPISTTTGVGDAVLDQALATIPTEVPATSAPSPAVPVPVEAPTSVDLAVPAPPPPPQPQTTPAAPASQPAPQPAPQPQATSSGS